MAPALPIPRPRLKKALQPVPAMAQESELPAQGPVTSTVLLLGLRLVLALHGGFFLRLCARLGFWAVLGVASEIISFL